MDNNVVKEVNQINLEDPLLMDIVNIINKVHNKI